MEAALRDIIDAEKLANQNIQIKELLLITSSR